MLIKCLFRVIRKPSEIKLSVDDRKTTLKRLNTINTTKTWGIMTAPDS